MGNKILRPPVQIMPPPVQLTPTPSPIILRPLDYNENGSIYHNDLSNFTKLFKIESDIDYYQHMDLLKDSIQKWVTIHPFIALGH